MLNWKVRLKNKTFWTTIIPALVLVIQTILAVFGIQFDTETVVGKAMIVVDAVFAVLTALGVVVDHTTVGIGDSEQALTYDVPKGAEE